jgi:hypothetical protein
VELSSLDPCPHALAGHIIAFSQQEEKAVAIFHEDMGGSFPLDVGP